jgi:hypothetical protein
VWLFLTFSVCLPTQHPDQVVPSLAPLLPTVVSGKHKKGEKIINLTDTLARVDLCKVYSCYLSFCVSFFVSFFDLRAPLCCGFDCAVAERVWLWRRFLGFSWRCPPRRSMRNHACCAMKCLPSTADATFELFCFLFMGGVCVCVSLCAAWLVLCTSDDP